MHIATEGLPPPPSCHIRASRRQILFGASIGALMATGAAAASPMPLARPFLHRGAVVSFHQDAPWVDETGLAFPYQQPSGCQSGSPVSGLSEDALRRLNCYL